MNMPFPVIDIILPTYNRYEILAEALESVRAQTYPHWECWIAEDGESAKTQDTVAPYLQDKRFHYLPGKHSGTPATPRNRALRAGQAPYIAFLDDDDIWLPDKLEQQVEFLKKHPHCVILGSNAFIMKENQDYRKDTLPLYFKKAPFGLVPYNRLVQDDYFINSSAVIRRSALKYAGLQNETLHKGPDGEDHDLWLRIGPLGEMWLMPVPLVVYRSLSSRYVHSPKTTGKKRREAYRIRFKIYQSALTGVGEIPSPLLFPEHDRQEQLCRRERDFYAAGPRFLGRLRHSIWSEIVSRLYRPPSKQQYREKTIQAFVACKARWEKLKSFSTVECIIFSKDRPLQLHGLLSTLREKVSPVVPVHVLYLATTPAHQKAYNDVRGIFKKPDICFIQQNNQHSFKHDLLEIIFSLNCDMLFFLVDDILFTEPVDLNDFLKFDPDVFIPSLRLGQNLTRCYVLQSPQSLPDFLDHPESQNNNIVWQWDQGELDWSYPLSVDGHFFAKREIAAMAALLSYRAPNSFEDQLQIFKPLFKTRYGVGYKKSRIVDIPCNRVQMEKNNLSSSISPSELLAKWNLGYQIDSKKLSGRVNESAHQEIALPLTRRVCPDSHKEFTDISIIIVSYNTAKLTLACLASLQTQDGLEKEIFVVDNSSTDKSVALIREGFPEVKVITNQINKGFGAANNQALKDCRGRYIIFLNPDTMVKPDTLQNAAAFMDANKHVGLAGAKILNPDGTLQESVSYRYPSEKFTSRETAQLQGNIACVLGAFMIAPKLLLDDLHGFDEDFFLYGEDQDLCWRIREKGFSIGYIEEAKVFHWGGQSEVQTPPAALQAKKLKAEYLFYQKHYLPTTIINIKKAQRLKARYRLATLKLLAPFVRNKYKLQNKIDSYKIALSMAQDGN